MTKDKKPSLEAAYDLRTPQDSIALYRNWANTYDAGFASEKGYHYPALVAKIFADHAGKNDHPVLDVGCGTGLVAGELAKYGTTEIDGLDISPQMLDVARTKGVYRALMTGDLTGRLAIADCTYGSLVSAGTFTHGHVGPDALDELLRIVRPGALLVVGINSKFFAAEPFADKFATLTATGSITEPAYFKMPIYQGAEHEHSDDTAEIAVLRRV